MLEEAPRVSGADSRERTTNGLHECPTAASLGPSQERRLDLREGLLSMGFSMRRHILSRANAVALERQLAQTKPLGAVFLFALRLSQSKVARCSMGSVRDRRCHFRFGLLTIDGGHTPYRSRLRIE